MTEQFDMDAYVAQRIINEFNERNSEIKNGGVTKDGITIWQANDTCYVDTKKLVQQKNINAPYKYVLIDIDDLSNIKNYQISSTLLTNIVVWRAGKIYAVENYLLTTDSFKIIQDLSESIHSLDIAMHDCEFVCSDARLFRKLLGLSYVDDNNKGKKDYEFHNSWHTKIFEQIGEMKNVKQLTIYDSCCGYCGKENELYSSIKKIKPKELTFMMLLYEKKAIELISDNFLETLTLYYVENKNAFIDAMMNHNKTISTLNLRQIEDDKALDLITNITTMPKLLKKFTILGKGVKVIGKEDKFDYKSFRELRKKLEMTHKITQIGNKEWELSFELII